MISREEAVALTLASVGVTYVPKDCYVLMLVELQQRDLFFLPVQCEAQRIACSALQHSCS